MSEIGSGSGSSYPGALDTNATVETNAPNPGKTKAKAEIVNDLAACILAIETELGVDPAGSKATVVARLDQEHNADGSHKDTLIVTVSGHNQNITGRKVFASGISLGVDGLYGTSTGHGAGKTTVGASGAMWFQDDVRTSGSIHLARNPVAGLEAAPKQYVDNNFSLSTHSHTQKQVFSSVGESNYNPSNDYYIPVNGSLSANSTVEAKVALRLPVAGTLTSVSAYIHTNASNGTFTVTIYKNGATTGQVLTVSAAATGWQTWTGSVSFVATDTISLRAINNGGSGSVLLETVVSQYEVTI